MSLNQLLYNHQLAKLNAQTAISQADRATYSELVGHYAQRITDYRRAHGLSDTGWPRDEREKP